MWRIKSSKYKPDECGNEYAFWPIMGNDSHQFTNSKMKQTEKNDRSIPSLALLQSNARQSIDCFDQDFVPLSRPGYVAATVFFAKIFDHGKL
jgi:hypothetical protein